MIRTKSNTKSDSVRVTKSDSVSDRRVCRRVGGRVGI